MQDKIGKAWLKDREYTILAGGRAYIYDSDGNFLCSSSDKEIDVKWMNANCKSVYPDNLPEKIKADFAKGE